MLFSFFSKAIVFPKSTAGFFRNVPIKQTEGRALSSTMKPRNALEPGITTNRTSVPRRTGTSSIFRVVTDIDDTVKSSGGVKLFGVPLGGIDTQYSRGEFYPGAFQFFFELSAHNRKTTMDIPKVAVLTARAKEFLFALALKPADKLCSAFRNIGEANGYPTWGIALEHVYYGSVAEW